MSARRFALLAFVLLACHAQTGSWTHLSTKTGDLEPPNSGTEQTSAIVLDIDKDGVNDFVITERTAAPSVVWYRRNPRGWKRYVIEKEALHIEAGTCFADIDGDGDLDIVAGGDWKSNQIWWWENPYPDFSPEVGWKRHLVKNSGAPKHHDQIFADVDGDGRPELIFWNQDAHGLFLARIPPDPRTAAAWPGTQIYSYSDAAEPPQRGRAAPFKGVNEHEGLAALDIDGDGKIDLIGGGRWFRNRGNGRFEAQAIDPGYSFSRAAAGQLIKGGRPEVVFVIGDGTGPLMLYQWEGHGWNGTKLLDVMYGHSLALVDFDGDGNLDIFCAEQRLNGGNPDAKIYLLLGDGKGGFRTTEVARGFDLHEAKIADLDGNGSLDILGKPYNWETPRLDIWLNPAGR
jgi:hypothetical protein